MEFAEGTGWIQGPNPALHQCVTPTLASLSGVVWRIRRLTNFKNYATIRRVSQQSPAASAQRLVVAA